MRRMRWIALGALLVLMAGCSKQETAGGTVAKGQIAWITDPKAGFAEAKKTGKPIMMDVMASWCAACKRLDSEVWSRKDVADVAKSYVAIKADGDKYPDVPKQHTVSGYPTTIFFTAQGKEVDRVRGAAPYEDMLDAMKGALGKASATK